MRPYYEHAGIMIYHADCRDVIDFLMADVVVTDPPFGIDGGNGHGNRRRHKATYEASSWSDTPDYIRSVCIPVFVSALDICSRGAVTPGKTMLADYITAKPPDDIGCFWSPSGIGFGSWGRVSFAPILYYGKDPRSGINKPGFGQVPSGRPLTESPPAVDHPCPKPYQTWKWLVNKTSLEGETVLDPFHGQRHNATCRQAPGAQGDRHRDRRALL